MVKQILINNGDKTAIFNVNDENTYLHLLKRSGYLQSQENFKKMTDEKNQQPLELHLSRNISITATITLLGILSLKNLPVVEELFEVSTIRSIVFFLDYMLVDSWKFLLDDFFMEALTTEETKQLSPCIEYLDNLHKINRLDSWLQFFKNTYQINILDFVNNSNIKRSKLKQKMRSHYRINKYKKSLKITHCKVCSNDLKIRIDKPISSILYIALTPCCEQIMHKHCIPEYLFHKRNPKVICKYCQTPLRNGSPDISEETLHSCLTRHKLRSEAEIEISPLSFPTLDYDGPSFPYVFPPSL